MPAIAPPEYLEPGAAVQVGQSIFKGIYHSDAREKIPLRLRMFGPPPIDGYVTNTGRFVGKEEGHKIAVAAKQARQWRDANDIEAPWLDSQDLKQPNTYTEPESRFGAYREGLEEKAMSRMLTLFRTSKVTLVSPEISMDTVKRMTELGREDFFKRLSEVLGRNIGLVTGQVTQQDIARYNAWALTKIKATKLPYIPVRGAFSYDGVNTTMERTLAFIGLSNADSVVLASHYFQQAYIYVNKGIFCYFDSADNQHYYATATQKWDEVFPGRVKHRSPGEEHLHSLGGSMKGGTLLKNKSFVVDFDFNKGADTSLVKAIESIYEMNTEVFVATVGHMPSDQATIELQLWIEKQRQDMETGNFDGVVMAAQKAAAYAQALGIASATPLPTDQPPRPASASAAQT